MLEGQASWPWGRERLPLGRDQRPRCCWRPVCQVCGRSVPRLDPRPWRVRVPQPQPAWSRSTLKRERWGPVSTEATGHSELSCQMLGLLEELPCALGTVVSALTTFSPPPEFSSQFINWSSDPF